MIDKRIPPPNCTSLLVIQSIYIFSERHNINKQVKGNSNVYNSQMPQTHIWFPAITLYKLLLHLSFWHGAYILPLVLFFPVHIHLLRTFSFLRINRKRDRQEVNSNANISPIRRLFEFQLQNSNISYNCIFGAAVMHIPWSFLSHANS